MTIVAHVLGSDTLSTLHCMNLHKLQDNVREIHMDAVLVSLSDKCNMICSWCTNYKKSLKENRPFVNKVSPKLKDILFSYIEKNHPDSVCFVGGEPLIHPIELFSIIDETIKLYPDIKIAIFTNGSLITEELRDKINTRNIRVVLSVNTTGEKSIENLINHALHPDKVISILATIKNLEVRYVALRKTPFAQSIVTLHKLFNCGIYVSLDTTDLDNWDMTDTKHIQNELALLKHIDEQYKSHVEFKYIKRFWCRCSGEISLDPDGKLRYPYFHSFNSTYGCGALRDKLGDEMYTKLLAVTDLYFDNCSNKECLCQL